jgi:CBS domain-containing protein
MLIDRKGAINMNASDVMVTNVIAIGPNASVQEVADILVINRISAAPVVDDYGELIGIISEGDLIRRAELGTERRGSWWLEIIASESKEDLAIEYMKSHASKVGDIMTREVITATPGTPLRDVAALLEKNRIKRVPIVEQGKMVGIVSRANLVQALAILRKDIEPGTTSDSVIREKVMAQLSSEPWTRFSTLNVTIQGGTVELWGVVGSEAEKEAARVAAEVVPGVCAVENNLIVRPLISGF